MIFPLNAGVQVASAQEHQRRGPTIHPVVVWPSGPLEVIAAFDKPIDPALARSIIGRTIPYVETLAATPDRVPSSLPSGALRVVGARLIDDGRTLVLATDPHPRVGRYLLPLSPVDRGPPVVRFDAKGVPYDLSGVEVAWSEEGGPDEPPRWSGWWPHLDPEAARRLTRGSKQHEAGLALLTQPGRLVLSTMIRLPAGTVTLQLDASGPIEEATLGDVQAEQANAASKDEDRHATLSVESKGDPLFLMLSLPTGKKDRPLALKASYRTAGDKAAHPIQRDQLLVPWAPWMPASAATAPLVVPDLNGGDPVRGQVIFSGDQARCSQCHAFRGQGGQVGPDLTEIGRKGRAGIYRSIAAPSATIDPGFTSFTVATKNGQVVVGVVRAEGADAIRVTDTNARGTLIQRSQIQQIRPSATSIMPVGLAGALGDAAMRDLIALLTLPPSSMPTAKPRPKP